MRLWNKKSSRDVVRDAILEVYPRIVRYSLVLTGDKTQADDLAQAACLRALEKSDQFEPGTHCDRWIFRVTQRLWINERRKQAVRTGGGLAAIEEANIVDPKPGPESSLHARQVMMGVMELPEAQRTVVLLVYVEGYSYRDAAMILDIPIGTIMSRLSVARGKLVQKFRDVNEVG